MEVEFEYECQADECDGYKNALSEDMPAEFMKMVDAAASSAVQGFVSHN